MAIKNEVTISELTVSDVSSLQQISRQTFTETFAADNSPEDLENYLDTTYSLEALTALLADPDVQFYGAYLNEELVGYMMLAQGASQSEKMPNDHMELVRIYVLKKAKGQGIGSALMNLAVAYAIQNRKPKLWLGVWEHNYAAQKFYIARGFYKFSEHVFTLGDSRQKDWLMVRDIDLG